jgi:hypothetical protein
MQLSEMIALVKGLKESVVLKSKVAELSPEVQYRVFLVARKLEAVAKTRKDKAKVALLTFVEANGKTDEKGSQHYIFAEGKAMRTRKVSSSPDVEAVEKLLADKNLDSVRAVKHVQRTDKVVDVSAMEQLVKLGVITQEELDACYPVSFSFNAYETKDFKKDLTEGIG